MRVLLRNSALRWHITAASLLLSNVILVCEGLLLLESLWHVTWVHIRLRGDVGTILLLGEMLRGGFFGRVDRVRVVDTVLAVTSRLGGIQACLLELANVY